MDWPMVVAFWGVSALLVLTPCVDWAYVISAGLGRRSGVLPAVLGVLTGHVLATFAVAAGVAALVAASPVTMTVLTVLIFAGSGYMIWLGVQTLRHPPGSDLETRAIIANNGKLFGKGLMMNLLNPKLYLFFLALLSQFISSTASWPVGVQIVVLGALRTATCAVVYFTVAYGAATVLTGRPRAAKVVSILSGVVMIGLGLVPVVEKPCPCSREPYRGCGRQFR